MNSVSDIVGAYVRFLVMNVALIGSFLYSVGAFSNEPVQSLTTATIAIYWFFAVIMIIAGLFSDHVAKEVAKKNSPSISPTLNFVVSLGEVMMLAYYGYPTLATCTFIGMMLMQVCMMKVREIRKGTV